MSYIVVQDGKIGLSEEGLLIEAVKSLLLSFKDNKDGFMECVRFVYYMGDKYSPYVNYIESERLVKIKREQFNYLSQDDFDKLSSNEKVLAVLEDYKDRTYDLLDRGWEGAKKKVDDFLKHLNTVPMTYKKTINTTIESKSGVKKKVAVDIEASNHEEYWKALKTYNEVMKFVSKVEEDIRKDTKEGKRKNTKRRLFDNEESLRIAKGTPRLLI